MAIWTRALRRGLACVLAWASILFCAGQVAAVAASPDPPHVRVTTTEPTIPEPTIPGPTVPVSTSIVPPAPTTVPTTPTPTTVGLNGHPRPPRSRVPDTTVTSPAADPSTAPFSPAGPPLDPVGPADFLSPVPWAPAAVGNAAAPASAGSDPATRLSAQAGRPGRAGTRGGGVSAVYQPQGGVGSSGSGFLGDSLHSAKAATRLYIPVGLVVVAVSVLFVQAHLAKRDPKLSQAPIRPDDDGLSFRE